MREHLHTLVRRREIKKGGEEKSLLKSSCLSTAHKLYHQENNVGVLSMPP